MSFISRLKEIFGINARLGLVLGSGGARGLAHIGVLKVLEEARIPIHCIVGTSAGALIGGLYCAGTRAVELQELLGGFTLKGVARVLMPTRGQGGIVDGRRLMELIRPHAAGKSIEDLTPRFACVATDLTFGEEVVFRNGDLLESIRASISIPGLFTPVVCGDRVLVDGGVVDPLPIRLAYELGATFAIVVRVGRKYSRTSPPDDGCVFRVGDDHEAVKAKGGPIPAALDVLVTTLSVYDHRLSEQSLRSAGDHVLVQPSLPGIEILDFHKGAQAIAAGEAAMRERMPEVEGIAGR